MQKKQKEDNGFPKNSEVVILNPNKQNYMWSSIVNITEIAKQLRGKSFNFKEGDQTRAFLSENKNYEQ